MLPVLVVPQVWALPAFTVSKIPSGGEDWPYESAPQHSTVPVAVIPQVCKRFVFTVSKIPSGGEDWP
jgi:hypothetical protein